MLVPPVGAAGASALTGATAASPFQGARPGAAAPPDTGFGDMVARGLQNVSQLEHTADAAAQDLATGGPTRLEDVMVATSQAQLGIELLARVRDRALEAYQEVMRLPL